MLIYLKINLIICFHSEIQISILFLLLFIPLLLPTLRRNFLGLHWLVVLLLLYSFFVRLALLFRLVLLFLLLDEPELLPQALQRLVRNCQANFINAVRLLVVKLDVLLALNMHNLGIHFVVVNHLVDYLLNSRQLDVGLSAKLFQLDILQTESTCQHHTFQSGFLELFLKLIAVLVYFIPNRHLSEVP